MQKIKKNTQMNKKNSSDLNAQQKKYLSFKRRSTNKMKGRICISLNINFKKQRKKQNHSFKKKELKK